MTEPGTGDILLSPGRSQGHRLTEPGTGNILLSPGRRTSPPRTQMTEPGSLCPGDFQLIKSIVLGVSTAGGGNFLVLLVRILEFLHQKRAFLKGLLSESTKNFRLRRAIKSNGKDS